MWKVDLYKKSEKVIFKNYVNIFYSANKNNFLETCDKTTLGKFSASN